MERTRLYDKVKATDGGDTWEPYGEPSWTKKDILEIAKRHYFENGMSLNGIRENDCDLTVYVGEGMEKRELTDQEGTTLGEMPRMGNGVFVKLSLYSKEKQSSKKTAITIIGITFVVGSMALFGLRGLSRVHRM